MTRKMKIWMRKVIITDREREREGERERERERDSSYLHRTRMTNGGAVQVLF